MEPINDPYNYLPDELKSQLPGLYETEGQPDPMVIIKYFTPDSSWTWYVVEGSEEEGDEGKDWRFFGLVDGHEKELGYFLLSELESARGPGGLKIERDLYFKQEPVSKFK